MALRFAATSLSFRCLPRAIAARGSTFQIGDGARFIGTTSTKKAPADVLKTKKETAKVPVPTMEMAKSMPLSCQEMDNTSLLTLAALKVKDARSEVLRRHIMRYVSDTTRVRYLLAYEIGIKPKSQQKPHMFHSLCLIIPLHHLNNW
jgi:hypothetical protein